MGKTGGNRKRARGAADEAKETRKARSGAAAESESEEPDFVAEGAPAAKSSRGRASKGKSGRDSRPTVEDDAGAGDSESEEDSEEELFLSSRGVDDGRRSGSVAGKGSGKAGESDVTEVEFCFVDPRDIHFSSVRALLVHFAPQPVRMQVFDMADAIVYQKCVGTMISVEGSTDDAYGVCTILPLRQLQRRAFFLTLCKLWLGKCPAPAWSALNCALGADAEATGLLVSERLVNMPPQLAPPLLESLLDDVAWAKKEGLDSERRDFSAVKAVLYSCPVQVEPKTLGALAQQRVSRVTETVYYMKYEDEMLADRAEWSFAYTDKREDVDRAANARVVMLVPIKELRAAASGIEKMFA